MVHNLAAAGASQTFAADAVGARTEPRGGDVECGAATAKRPQHVSGAELETLERMLAMNMERACA
jgi:hypothetical protein